MAILRPEGLSMKISSDNIANRTRDLPTCSKGAQPTAPPPSHVNTHLIENIIKRAVANL